VGVQVVVVPAVTLLGEQETETAVIVGVMVTVVTPEMVASWVLTALTTTEVPVVGAVNTPAEEMVPAEVTQVTAEE
jgi:hypothetical protein